MLGILYAILKGLPPKNKIVFLSRQSNDPSLDILLLRKKIKELHPDYKVVVLCKKLDGNGVSYCFHMLRQMYHLATSKAAILDSYCIPVSLLKHRPNLLVIQMWHSVGTMKKFGYSILDKPEGSSSRIAKAMRMHKGYDYVFAAGDGYKDHLAEGMNVDRDIILTYPLPRLEPLQDAEYIAKTRGKIVKRYPQLGKKKNIVYVPTFRKGDEEAFEEALNKLINAIDTDQYNFIPKLHPLTRLDGRNPKAVWDDRFTSMEMLTAADIVITDYSCILYEAAILKKPIYFYAYDFDHYMSTRSIYIDYKAEMPGPICESAEELAQAIKKGSFDYEKLHDFLNKYVAATGHETRDIVEFIFSKIETD